MKLSWITSSGRATAVRIDYPPSDKAVGSIVIVPTFAREAVVSSRFVRVLAVRAALRGFVVLSFAFSGDGDSGPLPEDNVDGAWLREAECVVDVARQIVGELPVHLIGLRLGACVASAMERRSGEIGVLWEPVSGSRFLRHHTMIRRLSVRVPPRKEGVELAGALLTSAQAASIAALSVPSDAQSADSGLYVRMETERDVANRMFLSSPHFATVPYGAIDEVLNVLPRHHAERISEWCGNTKVTVAVNGETSVVEEFVTVGPHGLWGIVTTAINVPARAGLALTAMGAELRSGPGDLWAAAARQLASEGVVTLRCDRRLLGDALDVEVPTEARPYTDDSVDDVIAQVQVLRGSTPGPVTAVGVCAGAWVFLRATESVQLDNLLVVNPMHWNPDSSVYDETFYRSFFQTDPDFLAMEPDDASRERESAHSLWSAVMHASRDIRHSLASRFPRLRALLRSNRLDERVGWLLKLVPSTTGLVMVMGPWENGRFRVEGGPEALESFRLRGGVSRVVVSKDIDHSLLSSDGQNAVLDELRGLLVEI